MDKKGILCNYGFILVEDNVESQTTFCNLGIKKKGAE